MVLGKDYIQETSKLFKEAFAFKKYKSMNGVFAVFCGIFVLPFVLISLFLATTLYVLGFVFNAITIPVKELYELLHKEGTEIKHATQFIIYWITWPIIVVFHLINAVISISLAINYAFCAIFTYIWSLGGFKFHIYCGQEDISKQAKGKYSIALPLVFIGINLLFVALIIVLMAVEGFYFEEALAACLPLSIIFDFIYIPVAFGPRPARQETTIAEPVEQDIQ